MKLLLDTCALLYIAFGRKLRENAAIELTKAIASDDVIISPASAWELGKLIASRKLTLTSNPLVLFESFVARPGFSLCELTPEILVKSSFLPDLKHKDPMDLLLIGTARTLDAVLVTSDRAILAYGAQGHVKTLAC